jgi:hypothetical protein
VDRSDTLPLLCRGTLSISIATVGRRASVPVGPPSHLPCRCFLHKEGTHARNRDWQSICRLAKRRDGVRVQRVLMAGFSLISRGGDL